MFDVIVVNNKPYDKVNSLPSKALLHTEVTEIQDIAFTHNKRTNIMSSGDGPSGDSFSVNVVNSNTLRVTKGLFIHLGEQLYVDEDVEIGYDYNLTTAGIDYVLVCKWRDMNVSYTDDPSILNPITGPTSTRKAKRMTFSIEIEDTAILAQDNIIILAELNFAQDINGLNVALTQSEVVDRRFEYTQHFVNSGLGVESVAVVGGFARITLYAGQFTYLGSLVTVSTLPQRVFDMPLTSVVTEARYLLYYTVSGGLPVPNVVAYTNTALLTGVPIKLFEVSVNSTGVVPGSINDIRIFMPNTRRSVELLLNDFIVPNEPVEVAYNVDGHLTRTFSANFLSTNSVAPAGWKLFTQTWEVHFPLGSGTKILLVDFKFSTLFQHMLNVLEHKKNIAGVLDIQYNFESFSDISYSHRILIPYTNSTGSVVVQRVNLTCYGF